ncbi:amino acid adenylation domain-containing protein [Actinoplanes sp. Pm04-4]|uniref:Amino acid adenylation domain-containing protein n=1 Tax=Paractinoplanes pyxinae TaxID=2997416 RepID=A0ABT4BC45_9ACTN|nr:amino acid adenylation domain-containing protein [Actinoplanes pyxinae]MCY1144093.1 amino acid adenylation domain-containing protein [Actinoplanes pyxinae]
MTAEPRPARTYPMSAEQESIWLNDQANAGRSRYIESWAYRLRGARLDRAAVQWALSEIVARHESLRSQLSLVEGEPRQTVLPPEPIELLVVETTESELPGALLSAAAWPLQLDRTPLLHATLLELGDDDAVLTVAVHHAVVDGWCFSLLDTEFSALYRQAVTGVHADLPALPQQFGPYAKQQRDAGEGSPRSLQYWGEAMRGAPVESSFPPDRPRPVLLGADGDRIEFDLDAGVRTGIYTAARSTRSTPFVVLAAAVAALIHRLADQQDIVIGTPVSRRDDESLDPLIACLSDVKPLRTRVNEDMTFRALVTAMRERVWGAVDHRDMPFSRMVRDRRVPRSASRFPLFQVVIGLDDAPAPMLDLPSLTAERLYPHSGTTKYDIFLNFVPTRDGFRGFLEYSTDLFERVTAQRLADRFQTLLTDAVLDLDREVGNLAIISPSERRLLLGSWSQPAVAAARPSLAHEAFTTWSSLTPQSPAVIHGSAELTYEQLASKSDALAARLVAVGVSGTPVGVLVQRGLNLAVAVLAVLKSGSACLPLDPAYPADRIRSMAADSRAEVVVTDPDLVGLLPTGLAVLGPEASDDRGVRAPLPQVKPADLAYLIYTSGSTGRPKGVAMSHRGLANLLSWQSVSSIAGPTVRTLQFAALGFDVAFQEFFSTWATGGTLVMVDDDVRRDPERLLDLLSAQRVERLFIPFVALQQIAEYACAADRRAGSLREVITAGEQLHATPAVRKFFAHHAPEASLENQYGPSETHVVTRERLGADPDRWPRLPPIGRPVPGARVHVLDRRNRICPAGVTGQIHIGGQALADGYLGQPELTAERFIEDPYNPGELLYRTGDVGKYLPDGRIQWIGRTDDQVKIRGHRVEPGEVTAAVRAVKGVSQAVTLTEKIDGIGTRLVVYYTCPGEDQIRPAALRKLLSRRLPDYLIPALCLLVPTFPFTPSGKLDTAALAGHRGQAEAVTVPPAEQLTPTERVIAGHWQHMLGVASVGNQDDFFALGGNSLLATRLVLRLREELQREIPLSALNADPTVAGLAATIDSSRSSVGRQTGLPNDLPAETTLPRDVTAADSVVHVAVSPESVLLTGATGFLGAFMLRALLNQTPATVFCLVRGPSADQAATRLRETLTRYGLWNDAADKRVEVVVGDLASPRLGLHADIFDHLARTVDAVYHVGAAVHLVASYETLKPATVSGTSEILRLAARHRSVPVHHISTIGVYAGPADGPIGPDRPIGPLQLLEHGYTRSKWVAEKLVDSARHRSLPVNVYRPSRIVGHTDTGACQTGDYMWLLIKGCIQVQAAPAVSQLSFDLVPVDYVSNAIVALSQMARAAGRTFHLAAGTLLRLETVLDWVRSWGYTAPTVPVPQWLAMIEADGDNAAYPLLTVFAAELSDEGSEGRHLIDISATEELLSSQVPLVAVDEATFGTYLQYFVDTGWLPPPLGQ